MCYQEYFRLTASSVTRRCLGYYFYHFVIAFRCKFLSVSWQITKVIIWNIFFKSLLQHVGHIVLKCVRKKITSVQFFNCITVSTTSHLFILLYKARFCFHIWRCIYNFYKSDSWPRNNKVYNANINTF